MYIKIGVKHVAREITIESGQNPDDVVKLIEKAIASDTVLKLVDKKDNVVMVPVAAIGYVELGKTESHSVGFGMM